MFMIVASLTILRPGKALYLGRSTLVGRKLGYSAALIRGRALVAGSATVGRHSKVKDCFIGLLNNRVCGLHVMWMSDTTTSSSSSSDVTTPSEGGGGGGDEASKVNLNGLKSEVDKSIYRTLKKLSKKKERLFKLSSGFDNSDPNIKDEIDEIELIILGFEENLQTLRDIDTELKTVKATSHPRLDEIVGRAAKLGVTDTPKEIQKRGPKKAKGKSTAPRLPYFTYKSNDGIEIRVGRASSDNDELSCNPKYRDGADWWLHVSGCPGSHVVIRSHDDSLQATYPETVVDAAILAVINSKASGAKGKVKVNLTRARNVSKPMGAKAGLVRLSGDIFTVSVDSKAESKRLERLNDTKNTL